MSINIPTIKNNLKFEISSNEVELNGLSQEFNEVYSYIGYGNFISACFKLSRDAAIFKFEIDDNVICEIDVSELATITHTANRDYHTPIVYDINDRVLVIKYNSAINYSRNIKFSFKRNSNGGGNNNRVQLESYAVSLTKENV